MAWGIFQRGALSYFKNTIYPKVEELLAMLEISISDGSKMYEIFSSMDTTQAGEIPLKAFYTEFGIKATKFTDRVFLYFDFDKSGEIDFAEFLIGVYNFSTFDHQRMAGWIYDIFDTNKKGSLNKFELDALMRMLYNVEEITPGLKVTIEDLPMNDEERVTLEEFQKASGERDRGLLSPAMSLQELTRKRTLGQKHWANLTAKRTHDFGAMTPIEDILLRRRREIHAEMQRRRAELMLKKNLTKKEQMRREEAERFAEEEEKRIQAEERWAAFGETEIAEMETRKRYESALENYKKDLKDDCEVDQKARDKQELTEAINAQIFASELAWGTREERANAELRAAQEIHADEFFGTRHGKKFLRLVGREHAIQQFNSRFGILSRKQAQFGRNKARNEFINKKVSELEVAVRSDFAEKRRRRMQEMKEVLGKYKILTVEEDKLAKWQWQVRVDEEADETYYYCPMTRGSIWDPPFIKNHGGQCMDPTCRLPATLRCLDCDLEYCIDCNIVAHSVGGRKYHPPPTEIPKEETDWRKALRLLNHKRGMPPEHRAVVEVMLVDPVEIARRQIMSDQELNESAIDAKEVNAEVVNFATGGVKLGLSGKVRRESEKKMQVVRRLSKGGRTHRLTIGPAHAFVFSPQVHPGGADQESGQESDDESEP